MIQQSEAFTVTNAGVYDFWTSEIQWNDTSEGCLLAIVCKVIVVHALE